MISPLLFFSTFCKYFSHSQNSKEIGRRAECRVDWLMAERGDGGAKYSSFACSRQQKIDDRS
jgi:hypothetical protein